MFDQAHIAGLANQILLSGPNEIVQNIILRDVLRVSKNHPELSILKQHLPHHRWVKELAQEQKPDGSWGRFHSHDSKQITKFPTSEIAIHRGLALGLEKDNPIFLKAIDYMQAVLNGKIAWSDRVEKSPGWPLYVEAITAGTLSQVDPTNHAIDEAWNYWAEIAQRSLSTGRYFEQNEIQAHRGIRGIRVVYLRSRYVLTLLGSRSKLLPAQLDRRIVKWIWNSQDGIGYLGAQLQRPDPFHINQWMDSLEILSNFQCWRDFAGEAVQWLWAQRSPGGLWDFGTKVSQTYFFPLSDNWRRLENRRLDYSTRVLSLLADFVK